MLGLSGLSLELLVRPCLLLHVSYPPWASGPIGAYSSISNGRETGHMKANPWYLLRTRLISGTILVLPIFKCPKKDTWPNLISVVWRNRIRFLCKKLWSNMKNINAEINEESGKENSIHLTKYFSNREIWDPLFQMLCVLYKLSQGNWRL